MARPKTSAWPQGGHIRCARQQAIFARRSGGVGLSGRPSNAYRQGPPNKNRSESSNQVLLSMRISVNRMQCREPSWPSPCVLPLRPYNRNRGPCMAESGSCAPGSATGMAHRFVFHELRSWGPAEDLRCNTCMHTHRERRDTLPRRGYLSELIEERGRLAGKCAQTLGASEGWSSPPPWRHATFAMMLPTALLGKASANSIRACAARLPGRATMWRLHGPSPLLTTIGATDMVRTEVSESNIDGPRGWRVWSSTRPGTTEQT